jgi:hopanoid biosynthesis associated RND transporter like protein HpnN
MLTTVITSVVVVCCRFAWLVLAIFVTLAGVSAEYTRTHFAINTDSSQLISTELDWRQRELTLDQAFPQRTDLIVVVIDGASPELADAAAEVLDGALKQHPERFGFVRQPENNPFFDHNGLLFLSQQDLAERTETLIRAQPFLGSIAADPTLRGLVTTLAFIAQAVKEGQAKLEDFTHQLQLLSDGLEALLDGRPPRLSWTEAMTGQVPAGRQLRRFIYVKPVLDYGALEPGATATAAIRDMAAKLELDQPHGITIRLTGPVPMADEEFATIAEGAALNTAMTVLCVLLVAWLALRSARIILAVVLTLLVGLAATAAAGLWMVGALNLISVAFAVLFIGIGIDFGIQFGVRYRAERHLLGDLKPALHSAAREAAIPLALAAAATAAGFFSFLPTDYRGLSELGVIAGSGMLIAFLTNITLLPALLTILKPPGETAAIGYPWLVPVDRMLAWARIPILLCTGLAVAAGLPLLRHVSFDFNPLNLRSANVESVATYLELMHDPTTTGNSIELLAPTAADGANLARRLRALPDVASVTSLESFIPAGQQEKLRVIGDVAQLLGPTLNPTQLRPPPRDEETIAALLAAAAAFAQTRGAGEQPDRAAQHLAQVLERLGKASAQVRANAEAALLPGLLRAVAKVRASLAAAPVNSDSIPEEIKRDWLTDDGRVRLEVAPKGDAQDNDTLRQFASAVLAAAPEATGSPVLIQQSAATIVFAFAQAGILAFASITVILFVVLRRISDICYTLLPLVLAGVVTLEMCALLDLKLNFANIIALPLLLGVGVAFKIYYVLAWRAGETSLLASSLTRAVFFSAMATATAFGSLWLSSHPGTSSMGKLMSLSLLTTLIAAVVFQPILMGPPRNPKRRDAMSGAAATSKSTATTTARTTR